MKEKKSIQNIERNLSFKRIKHQKKYSALILGIAILTCVLMQLGFQMTSGIQETFRETKREVYGEWERILIQIDSQSETVVDNNPFISQKGHIRIYGVLNGDSLLNTQSNIGTIDDTAWKLGRLKLRSGRLPQSSEEIAMEYSMLAALGCEEKLGESITLQIVPSVEYQSKETPKVLTYTLCGIIKDYQVNWETSNRNRLPTGIVTEEGGKKIGNILESHMLIKARDGYESVYEELEKSEEVTCKIGENFSKGRLVTDKIPFEKFLDSIRLLTAGAAICILFITLSHSIDAREDFWYFLKALGMQNRQMYQMIAWEAVIYCTVSSLIGTAAGIVLYKITLPAFAKVSGMTAIIRISVKAAIYGILCGILVIGISYLFSCMRLNRLLRGGETKKQKRQKKKKGHSVSKFTPLSIVLHQWRYRSIPKTVQLLLLTSTLIVTGLGLLETIHQKEELEIFRRMTGNGYFLDTEGVPNSYGIRKNTIRSFEQIAGVESVEAYHSSYGIGGAFTVDLSQYSDSEYLQEVLKTEQYFRENAGIEAATMQTMPMNILGITQWRDMKRFVDNLSEGKITPEDFEHDDFYILVLPPLEKTSYGYMGNVVEEQFQESFLMEKTIKTGDLLEITYQNPNGEAIKQQIPVAAILRTSKKADVRSPYPGGSGIFILTGEKFWEKFRIGITKDYCQQARINLSSDADAFDTEEHILRNLRSVGTLNLRNYHEEYRQDQQNLYSFIGMYSIFSVFYMILAFIVLYQMLEAEAHEQKQKIKVFKALGMEDRFIARIRKVEVVLMISLALIGSGVVLGCYYVMKIQL